MRVLVTGATGYVGGRLVPRLLAAGHEVRVLVRDPTRLAGRDWAGQVEARRGDALDAASLAPALAGVEAAYYLVHSMDGLPDFAARDRQAAQCFGAAARQAGVGRIVYLGGLGDSRTVLSTHLASRQDTGLALGAAGVPVTELRAAVIVGSGSLSFEMVRYLTERLPVMLCPRWVMQRIQPIGIRDVLSYLVATLEVPDSAGRVIEIGGADALTYREMLLGYASLRGLRRWLLPVPVLTPELSSHWVHWMTPIPVGLARPLIEGLRSEVVVRDDLARRLFPAIQPLPYLEACRLALQRTTRGETETRWADALWTSAGDERPVTFESEQGMLVERRRLIVPVSPEAAWRAFAGLGGERGWLYADWLWQVRGLMDRAVGGVGLRRGRRDPDDLRVGDTLDFWRVEAAEPPGLLRLRAEMRVPGLAWLEFEARPSGEGTLLVQTAYFEPRGLLGVLYWYSLYPVHKVLFSALITRLAARAVRLAAETASAPPPPAA
jgi:uncharacterized protein YbjT (DUF2867 family)